MCRFFICSMEVTKKYADIEDGWDFHKTRKRKYRNTLTNLKEASTEWKKHGNLSFILQLGDLLDGKCAQTKQEDKALQTVLKEFEGFNVYHLIGNHELYNFSRDTFLKKLNGHQSNAYYSVVIHPGWRLVVLDGYEICTIQQETKDEAVKFLSKYNPNEITRNDRDWLSGLSGLQKRFMPYNGKVSPKQLAWLCEELESATTNNENVLVACHVPVCPGSAGNENLLWNYNEVLDIFHSFTCVKAFFAGHDHVGGYAKDINNIHYKTFESPLETPDGLNAFAIVDVFSNRLRINGVGVVESVELGFL